MAWSIHANRMQTPENKILVQCFVEHYIGSDAPCNILETEYVFVMLGGGIHLQWVKVLRSKGLNRTYFSRPAVR
jgi:hypothetical protein